MAVRKETIKAQMETALRSILQPGEQETASVLAIAGPSPWLAMGVLGLIGALFTRYYYATVTNQRVIFVGTSRWTQRPKGMAFADPRSSAALESVKPSTLWSVIRYRRPDGSVLRLNVHRIWRQEFDAFVQALGGTVT